MGVKYIVRYCPIILFWVCPRSKSILVKSINDQRYIEMVALVRKARERVGLTQWELAQALGRPQSYVSKVETCERRLDFIELLHICRALGVTLREVTPTEFHGSLDAARSG